MAHLHLGYFTAGLDADPELAGSIRGELRRQQDGIELIASENIVSRLVLEAQGSTLNLPPESSLNSSSLIGPHVTHCRIKILLLPHRAMTLISLR